MERKQFGSVFVLFGIISTIYGMAVNYLSADLEEKFLGISLILFAVALIIAGALIVLFASNEDIEISYTYYIIFLVAGALIGGILSNFDSLITIGFALVGTVSAPLLTFFRSY